MNPAERFDIQVLNAARFTGLIEAIGDDPRLLREVAERAEMLMVRVKQEVDDPLSAGAFLRERVLEWYRLSVGNPEWSAQIPPRWAGIFTDSRVSGGKLVPWLNTRLWSLRESAARARGLTTRLRRSLLRDRGGDAAVTRSPAQQIQAEVAQAVLDDLAGRGRDPESPVPLVRLSELAVRRQVQTVNDALAALFASPETGPFVILHPNRYPDCEQLDIRPPAPTASGAALAYSLSPARTPRRPARAGSGAGSAEPLASGGEATEERLDGQEDLDASTIWEAENVSAATWVRVVDERRRERHRLDAPPKDYRARAAWATLRSLVLENPDFRKAFLAAKWRGRPSGLPLLAQLLQKGSFAPEVATDHEYLEAELGELQQGDPQWRPENSVWHIGEWTITREGTHHEGYRYVAGEGRVQPAR
jgi:hypothetical protein